MAPMPMTKTQWTKVLAALAVAVVLLIIIFQNRAMVGVRLLIVEIKMPMVVLLMVTLLMGFILGVLVLGILKTRSRRPPR